MKPEIPKFKFELEVDLMKASPAVYVPRTFEGRERFSVTAPYLLVRDLIDVNLYGGERPVSIASQLRPRVIPGFKPLDQIVTELQRLDAQNLSRDMIFCGELIAVTAAQYFWHDHRIDGSIGGLRLSLVSVEFRSNRGSV